jgi:LAO/AO transport system kinase
VSAATAARDYATRLLAGDRLALARVISKFENRDRDSGEILKHIFQKTGRAHVWGITGPPGAGKSTLVDQMVRVLRTQGLRVAVVAIDPSSPFTGGAILGDRIRMQDHTSDAGVFIRSLGTRGKQGGLSHATLETVLALDAAAFDVILVETAGVGQTELEVLGLAQQVVVVLVPESGDSVQMMKAGLLEIADLFVVNKSDRPDADRLVHHLDGVLDLTPSMRRRPDILKSQATIGAGVKEVVDHLLHLAGQNLEERQRRSREFLKREVLHILIERLSSSVQQAFETSSGIDLLAQLEARQIDPISAADLLSGN